MFSPAIFHPGTKDPCTNLQKIPRNQISPIKIRTTQSFNPLKPNKIKVKPIAIRASSTSNRTNHAVHGSRKNRGVVDNPPVPEKPRLVLKFIWMEKNIGIALDQLIPGGYGTVPVSPYYFWPRRDAWEEMRVLLQSKNWISSKQMVVLLNQATDIINLWQQNGGNLA